MLIGYFTLPLAWWLQWRKLWRGSIVALIVCAFLFRLGASLDPTLHKWDERYHALVAKRLAETPLTPRLIPDAKFPHDATDWTNAHIWLHKPPMALWCMAAAIKVFGAEAWAVRLPSTLLSALAVGLLALLARSMFSAGVAFWAALLFAINGHLIELASGRTSTDHVDAMLMAFVLAAIYAAWNMAGTRKFSWAFLCGLLTGCAFLTKSWPALIVLPVAVSMLWARQSAGLAKNLSLLAVIMAAGTTLALPWTLYIVQQFPSELAAEHAAVLSHFTAGIEEHGRPWYYYLAQLPMMQGELVILALGLSCFLVFRSSHREHIVLLTWATITYTVFSLATTKMPAYTAIAFPAFFMMIAVAVQHFGTFLQGPSRMRVPALIVVAGLLVLPLRFSLDRTRPWAKAEAEYELPQEPWTRDPRSVVTNCTNPVELMFHTSVEAAYSGPLSKRQEEALITSGYRIVDMTASPMAQMP